MSQVLDQWERQRDLQGIQRTAVYLSAPLTTGRTFIRWFRESRERLQPGSEEYATELRANVILPNLRRAAAFLELIRWSHAGLIINPTFLDVPGWNQHEYHDFWATVIERHVRRMILLDGWESSQGCTLEFEVAQRLSLDCVDERLEALPRERGLALMKAGLDECFELGVDVSGIRRVYDRLRTSRVSTTAPESRRLYKDEVLDRLAPTANVAQFVSFEPGTDLKQRYCRIRGVAPNQRFSSVADAVSTLFEHSPERLLNVRTFDPERPEGNPFVRRLASVQEVLSQLDQLGRAKGLYTIVNETIDESDGGVSGVAYRGILEFAPDATPRCVDEEDPQTAVLPMELGMALLRSVYGFEPDLRGREGARIEFSIHPGRRGWLNDHTVIWQVEQRPATELKVGIEWPNRFSRMLGDKTFGLALAAAAGLSVPRSVAFTRRLFPFSFGESTGSGQYWTRTCPAEKVPGYYPSVKRWVDPLAVLQDWHVLSPGSGSGSRGSLTPDAPLAGVLTQEAVPARYSGRVVFGGKSDPSIAGVRGEGARFMVGDEGAGVLSSDVIENVRIAHQKACDVLGPVDLEWVFDGFCAWIVQLNPSHFNRRPVQTAEAIQWIEFRYEQGRLEEFRQQVLTLRGTKKGIAILGNVSPLSHVGEIVELYGVPARFVKLEQ